MQLISDVNDRRLMLASDALYSDYITGVKVHVTKGVEGGDTSAK